MELKAGSKRRVRQEEELSIQEFCRRWVKDRRVDSSPACWFCQMLDMREHRWECLDVRSAAERHWQRFRTWPKNVWYKERAVPRNLH